jgi:hypothetical protein
LIDYMDDIIDFFLPQIGTRQLKVQNNLSTNYKETKGFKELFGKKKENSCELQSVSSYY